MSDIVERLARANCIKPCQFGTFQSPNLPENCACAAAEEAYVEIERLREMYTKSDQENDELRAEVERLKAALECANDPTWEKDR